MIRDDIDPIGFLKKQGYLVNDFSLNPDYSVSEVAAKLSTATGKQVTSKQLEAILDYARWKERGLQRNEKGMITEGIIKDA